MPTIHHKGNNLFSFTLLWLKEFVPVVRFDRASFKAGKSALLLERKDAVELSDKIDAHKRKASLISIITSPGNLTVPFKVERGMESLDRDGYLTPKTSGLFTNVSITPSAPFEICLDKSFELKVNITGNDKRQFFVDFYANDNPDDFFQGDLKNIFCGRVEFKVYPDVFMEHECDRLIDEINFIQPFADAGSPSEYAGNYCMSAAERGLSKLLNNTSDFYSVDRSHKRLNNIGFGGKNANDRGAFFHTQGFVESSFVFKDYQIKHKLRLATKNDVDFSANLYDVVQLNTGSELQKYLQNSIQDKIGFHVYYLSITEAFHTLLLVVDNRNPGNEQYAIYDQHGKTSSFGNFSDIEAGFARQTSWTFLNSYRNSGYKPNIYTGVTTRLWKIRRKL